MRTDGVSLSHEAIDAARKLIHDSYGDSYVPASPRMYKTTAKNAQEAHEAIRPTDMFRRPEDAARYLDKDELRLYELIWKRTVASQMASAVLDQATVDIASAPKGEAVFRATGSIVVFDGFLRVYKEDRDDDHDEDAERRLPAVKEKDPLQRQGDIRAEQHATQPPPRYTEASLVKRLEELGIGRPSTYASILQVLQDRAYVRLDKKRFVPEDRGRLVTAFLESFFERYVEYNFTADLENQLDEISGGRVEWKSVLREFWTAFHAAVAGTKDLTITQVIDTLDASLGSHFFPAVGVDGGDPRSCPNCHSGRLGLKLSRNGAFIGCSRYPECRYTRPLAVATGNGDEAPEALEGPRLLGSDPDTGLPVTVRRGPYGAYVQLGPANAPAPAPEPVPSGATKGKKKAKVEVEKPKRVSIPKGLPPADVDLDIGLRLLALPREVGKHPESNDTITAGIGRFGPYLKLGNLYKSLADDDDVLTIGLNRAVVLLGESKQRAASAVPARALGNHPADGKPVTVGAGRFGPYAKHGSLYASLPKAVSPDTVTLEQALELLAAKAAKTGGAAKGKVPAAAKAIGKTTVKAETAAPEAPAKAKAPAKTAGPAKKAAAPAKKAAAPAKKAAAPAKKAAKPKAAANDAKPKGRKAAS